MYNNEKPIRISEIFGPTIQGEGILIGEPTIFVRSSGCDFRCSWCDSLHAVIPHKENNWLFLSISEIWEKIEQLSQKKPITITISGGNPALQPFQPLIKKAKKLNYKVTIETQGSIYKNWFDLLDVIVLSPKPPSSNMTNDWQVIEQCLNSKATTKIFKIPVLDEEDYIFAKKLANIYPNQLFYLQPVNDMPPDIHGNGEVDLTILIDRFKWLIDQATKDCWYNVRILPQLHVMIWGNLKGV